MNWNKFWHNVRYFLSWEIAPYKERLEGVQGSERRLVGEPRSGSQPDGAEKRSGEDSGVGKTVEQSKCPHCTGGYITVASSCGRYGLIPCQWCGGTGQRSGLPNDKIHP